MEKERDENSQSSVLLNIGFQCLFMTNAWTSGVYFDTCIPFLKGKINQQNQSPQTESVQGEINRFLTKTVFSFEKFKC